MKANQFNEFECSNKNFSTKMSDYNFRQVSNILYVSYKVTNKIVFTILDVTDLNNTFSYVKCLIKSSSTEFRKYYSVSELKSLFKDVEKSQFKKIEKMKLSASMILISLFLLRLQPKLQKIILTAIVKIFFLIKIYFNQMYYRIT